MGCRGLWEWVSGRDGGLVGRGGMYGMAWSWRGGGLLRREVGMSLWE